MSHKRERRRILRAVDHWRPILGLAEWELALTFHAGKFIDADGKACEAIASTAARWQYLHGSLAFNTDLTAELSQPALERVVVHELAHLVVNEMRAQNLPDGWHRDEGDAAHEERVVSLVTAAVLRAAGWSTERLTE